MRQDIEIHINTGDITLPASNYPLYKDFKWLEEEIDGELISYLYGEVEVEGTISEKKLLTLGFSVKIPYTPIYKPFKLRIKRIYGDGSFTYLVNPKDGTNWWVVQCSLYGKENNTPSPIKASELLLVEHECYYLYFANTTEIINEQEYFHYSGYIQIFSAYQKDFNIKRVDRQNGNLLLKCIPTNNYRYPLSGVGLIRWINGDISQSSLAQTIQDEFADDDVIIRAASIDNNTNSLSIDANFDNLD